MSRDAQITLAYGLWPLVLINSAVFLLFAFSFLTPRILLRCQVRGIPFREFLLVEAALTAFVRRDVGNILVYPFLQLTLDESSQFLLLLRRERQQPPDTSCLQPCAAARPFAHAGTHFIAQHFLKDILKVRL